MVCLMSGSPGFVNCVRGYRRCSGWEPEPEKLQWRSTEHNIDVLAAARRLAPATNDVKWQDMADHATQFLDRMYNPNGHFWTGTSLNGSTRRDIIPLDCQTWAILVSPDDSRNKRLLAWSETNLIAMDRWQGDDVTGYSYSTAERGVWAEGSAQMGLAYLQAGDGVKAQEVLENLRRIQQEYPRGDRRGLVAACRTKLATGFGDYYYPELSTAATCWLYLLEMQYNPLLGKTIDTAPKGQ